MKALLSQQITRERQSIGDWEPSEHHLTDEGREAFRSRQLKRIRDAEKAKPANVQPIKRRTA